MIAVYATDAGQPWSTRELIWRSDLNSKEIGIYGAKLKVELNKAGSFDFTVSPSHPYYHRFKQMGTMLTVVCGNSVEDTLFRGRVSKITVDAQMQKKITAEEVLIFLSDSVLRPIGKEEKKTPKSMFYWAIASHNSEFANVDHHPDKEKHFSTKSSGVAYPSIVSLDNDPSRGDDWAPSQDDQNPDPEILPDRLVNLDKALVYSESSYQEPFKFIESELIDELGGYLRVHYDDDYVTQFLDWVSPSQYVHSYFRGNSSNKPIRSLIFGSNIIDIQREANTDDLFTVLLPSGDNKLTPRWTWNSEADDRSVNVYGLDGQVETVKVRLTGDRAIILGSPYTVNGVTGYSGGFIEYGSIYHAENFGGVNNRTKLEESTINYIINNYRPSLVSYKIKAIDQNLINDPLRLGERVYVPATTAVEQMDSGVFRTNLRVTQADYDLIEPQNSQFTIGLPVQTLTEKNRKSSRSGGKRSDKNETETDTTTTETKKSVQTLEASAKDILGNTYVGQGKQVTTIETTTYATNSEGVREQQGETKRTTTEVTTTGLRFLPAAEGKPGNEKSVDDRIQKHRHQLTVSFSNGNFLITLGDEAYTPYSGGDAQTGTYGIDQNGLAFVNFNMAATTWYQQQIAAAEARGRQSGGGSVTLPTANIGIASNDLSLRGKSVRVYFKLSNGKLSNQVYKNIEYLDPYPNDNEYF